MTIHFHRTQKVLIALYENGTPFEFRCLAPDTPQHAAEWQRRWPLRKFALLVDGERNVVETSIIIEYQYPPDTGQGAAGRLFARFSARAQQSRQSLVGVR